MKNKNLSGTPAWVTSIRTFVNGDPFIETNIDNLAGDIADRLQYLKNAIDACAKLAGPNALAGFWTWAPGAVSGIDVQGDLGVTTTDLNVSGFMTVANQANFTSAAAIDLACPVTYDTGATALAVALTLADAAVNIPATGTAFRVPILTATRIYSLPASAGTGREISIEKMHSDAFKATIKLGGATIAELNGAGTNGPGCVKLRDSASGWTVTSFSGDVGSMAATV